MISLASLIAIYVIIDLERFIQALRMADYRFVALVFGFTVCWLLVRGVVWRTLLQEKATFPQTFWAVNQGYLLNNLLPFRLGEVGRSFLLSRKAGLGFFHVLSTVVIERSLDVAFAAGILLAALPSVIGAAWARQAAFAAGGLVLAFLFSLYLLAHFREAAVKAYIKLSGRWQFFGRFSSQLSAFLNGLAVLDDPRQFLKAIFWMAVDWGVAILMFYALMLAFFPDAQLVWGLFTLGVMAIGIAVPSSPGAVGVQELAVVGALAAFKLDASVALAAAITAHLSNYLITGLLGAYALMRDGETLADVYKSVRHISTEPPPSESLE